MDWMRLTRTHPDLAGLNGARPRKMTMEEVKKHNKPDDAWTVLHGKVYNMTAYISFHPGGKPMIMAGAGKDCTALFQKYHRWVNGEMMLEKCLVGAVETDLEQIEEDMGEMSQELSGEGSSESDTSTDDEDADATAGASTAT